MSETPPRTFSARPQVILQTVGLAGLVFLAYWPLVRAGFIWDDFTWIVTNPWVHHWSGLEHIWGVIDTGAQYYPLVFTAFLLQYKLWGLHPLGYHLVSIALQAVNAILLWRILLRLGLKSAWIIAAIFAIHPVQVETVGWVMEQKNLLSALFYFAAVSAWLRFTKLGRAPGDNPMAGLRPTAHHRIAMRCSVRTAWYLLATLFYILALLAKTDACTLPAVLLLLAWWKRGRLQWQEILAVVPWFAAGVALATVTVYVEHHAAGASGAQFQFTMTQRALIAGRNLWFYPVKLLWPWPLLEIYPRWNVGNLGGWQWLYPIAALTVPAALLAWHRRLGRGPFVAIAFYGITISPVLGFISFEYQIYSFVADHFQYLACIGWIALAVEGGHRLLRWSTQIHGEIVSTKRGRPARPLVTVATSGIVLVMLGTLTWHQSGVYSTLFRSARHEIGHVRLPIWSHVLKYYPNCPVALEKVGVYECEHGRPDSGMVLLLRALQITRGNFPALRPILQANIGDIYRLYFRDYAAAAGYYRLALRHDPLMLFAIARLTQCYEQLGQWPRAFATLRRGLSEFPHSVSLHLALANALAMRGDYRAAAFQYRLIVQAEPHNAKALYNLAVTLQKLGKTPAALATYQQALRWAPRWARAYFMYGQCLLAHGQPLAAAGQFRQAIAFAPAYPPIYRAAAYQALARALAAAGHAHQATAALARAAQLQDHKRISSERPLVKMPR